MAVFDDPNRELDRLQRQLLEEEEQELEELVEAFTDSDYEDCFQENYEEETREPFYRNHAKGYGMEIRNFANGYRGEALFDEEAEFEEDVSPKAHRRRSVRGLIAVGIFFALVSFVTRRLGLW